MNNERVIDWRTASLADFPDLAKEYVPGKQKTLPKHISARSRKKVSWRCGKGHLWQGTPYSRVWEGVNCPYCHCCSTEEEKRQTLADFPEIAKEYVPGKKRNREVLPKHVPARSKKYVFWRCENGHAYRETPYARIVEGEKCPECHISSSGAEQERGEAMPSLAKVNPDLASEYSDGNSISADLMNTRSRRRVSWHCQKCGFTWKARVRTRVEGASNCPQCAGRIRERKRKPLKLVTPKRRKERKNAE